MTYRVVFQCRSGMKTKQMEAANPIAAINRVLREWTNVDQIARVETVLETEVGEDTQPADLDLSEEQHIHVNVSK